MSKLYVNALAPSSRICILFLNLLGQHEFLGFENNFFWNVYVFFRNIFSQNLKLVYRFESLTIKSLQGSKLVHFVVLAPWFQCCCYHF